MQARADITADECAEILVNTMDDRPRGSASEREKPMTSFEKFIFMRDPRNEHSYAFSDNILFRKEMDKDHCYFYSHRRARSLSDENLAERSQGDIHLDNYLVLPQYQSNDSALDVTGFDSLSGKCQSYENVQTQDVYESCCILPGISDPDLSRMSIQSQVEVETQPDILLTKQSPNDHSYCSNVQEGMDDVDIENTKHNLFKDHAYDASSHEREQNMGHLTQRRRRDSLPLNTSVKRGHSNDDLTRLGQNVFKRKDFKNSPFLDHSYQSLELHNTCAYSSDVKELSKGEESVKSKIHPKDKAPKSQKQNDPDVPNHALMSVMFYPKQPFLDHTYEEFEDATADISLSDFIERVKDDRKTGKLCSTVKTQKYKYTSMVKTTEIQTENFDHSYVIKSEGCDFEKLSVDSMTPSDSGTESLNEEEDLNDSSCTIEMYLKEHPYSKAVNDRNGDTYRHLPP